MFLGLLGQSCWKLLGFPSFHASFWKEMIWGAKESCQVRHCLPEKPVSREQNLSCGAGGGYRELLLGLWDCVLPWQKWYRGRVLLSSFWGESKKEWRVKILPQKWLWDRAASFTLLLRPLLCCAKAVAYGGWGDNWPGSCCVVLLRASLPCARWHCYLWSCALKPDKEAIWSSPAKIDYSKMVTN